MNNRLNPQVQAPTSNPVEQEEEAKIDVIAELAAWRKERKKAYEDELARYKMTRATTGRMNSVKGPVQGNGSHNNEANSLSGPRGYGYGFDHGAGPGSLAYAPTNGNDMVPARPQTPLGPGGEINDLDMKIVEGHWKGEIKVVRNATPKGRTGVVDMYGNYFEKGYLYP